MWPRFSTAQTIRASIVRCAHANSLLAALEIGTSTERAISRVLDDCLLTDGEMREDKDAWVQMCADAGDPFYEDWYNAIESFAGNPENVHSHDHHHEHGHD